MKNNIITGTSAESAVEFSYDAFRTAYDELKNVDKQDFLKSILITDFTFLHNRILNTKDGKCYFISRETWKECIEKYGSTKEVSFLDIFGIPVFDSEEKVMDVIKENYVFFSDNWNSYRINE